MQVQKHLHVVYLKKGNKDMLDSTEFKYKGLYEASEILLRLWSRMKFIEHLLKATNS